MKPQVTPNQNKQSGKGTEGKAVLHSSYLCRNNQSRMDRISVVIITLNEAGRIARCLESVQPVADEIVVLDSGSTDDTVRIAEKWGAKIFHSPFNGYIEQKNKALDFASHRYVLSLDADEALSEELCASLLKAKENLCFDAYHMNRCTSYCGKFIRHGSWYPDRKTRLFNKEKAKWGGVNPHDKVETTPECRLHHLKGDILHYSYDTLEEHIHQNNRFSTISAHSYYRKGKKARYWQFILNPAWAFLQGYIFQLGFLDGFRGYVIARNVAHMTFMKYYKLKALEKGIPVERHPV
jgi:glycosyltransferase involved in cell wall biosynthesis